MKKVVVELPMWLVRRENLPRVMEGKIVEETEKGVLFVGQCLIKESPTCLRCGQKLTHKASQAVGYGEVCCHHLGIPYPSLDNAEILKQQLIDATNVRRWLPKSQIIVTGDYYVPTEADIPTRMSICGDTLRLYCHPKYRHIPKSIAGYQWNAEKRSWDFPIKPEIARLLVEAFREHGSIQYTTKIRDLITKVVDIPTNKLFDYQVDGVRFLVNTEHALLADEMGLGKTVQALVACKANKAKRVLVVCPNTLKWTWEKEIKKWLPEEKDSIVIVEGEQKKRLEQYKKAVRFTLVNYEVLTYERDSKGKKPRPWSKDVKALQRQKWDTIIIDEAARIKNRKTQVSKATRLLTKKAKHVYLLTGTPMLNKVEELWSLLNSLYPRIFGSYWRFVEEYCYVNYNGWGYEVGNLRPSKAEDLRKVLDTLSLRRLKRDVLKTLPGKLPVKRIWVPLKGEQLKVYNEMAKEMYTKLLTGEVVSAAVIVAQIMRLKQIAVDHHLMLEETKQPLQGAKIDALFELLGSLTVGVDKVVIFSQFVRALDRLELIFKEKKIPYAKLTGNTKSQEREREIERFQTDRHCGIFLCSTLAGGLGVTLTASHIAIFLDKLWSPAMNWQAQERLDRIGQTEKVTIVELLASNTIEEGIEKMLKEKTHQFSSLFRIEDSKQMEIEVSHKNELLELIKYGVDV